MASAHRDWTGYILADKYEILRRQGGGGMSTIWLATDKNLEGKLWAVKEFRHMETDESGDAFKQSLVAEANLMKKLDHPSIVRVVDIVDTGETVFVVMDYIQGRTLSDTLRLSGHALAQDDVIKWGIELCDALSYLHGQQPPIVHRDIKPSNVMLRDEGSIKLIDFGVAREYKEDKTHDTRVIATQGYAAPEQLNPNVQTDPRADIYSLGVTLYHLVTGHDPTKPPFEMRPIREWNPQLSEGLEAIITRAVQPDPDKRYQSADEMRYDLEHYKKMTSEYRAVLQHKVSVFRRWAVASAVLLAFGAACFAGSAALKNSTYESYVHSAQNSSSEEQVAPDGTVSASPAEVNYTSAIELNPGRIENYQALVELYKKDLLFTPAEALRWQQIWAKHSPSVVSDPAYARLNYDVGMLYLCYYDFGSTGDAGANRTTGAAAVENATRAQDWFQRAEDALASEAAVTAFGETDLESLEALSVVSRFTGAVGQASAEGREREVYGELWRALMDAFEKASSEPAQETMVRLRLYQVVYETLGSQRYLRGLRRAGVTMDDAEALLEKVESATRALEDDARSNEQSLLPIYEEIVEGEASARRNIRVVYESAVAASGTESSEQAEEPETESSS